MAGRRSRGGYRFTPKRRGALKKAQLISARKRSRNRKKLAIGAGVLAAGGLAVGGVAFYKHRSSSNGRKIASRAKFDADFKATKAKLEAKSPLGSGDLPVKVEEARAITTGKKIPALILTQEEAELSHISNIGKRKRLERKAATGEGAGGAADSRIIKYEPSEAHLIQKEQDDIKFETFMRKLNKRIAKKHGI